MTTRILAHMPATHRNPITGNGCPPCSTPKGRRHFSIITGAETSIHKGKRTYPTPPPSPSKEYTLQRRVSDGFKGAPTLKGIFG